MKRLVIDTCFAACSAAVITPERTVAAYEPMARGHAEALMPMIAKVMAEADMDFSELDDIVVTTGPGTFTGMRVGIAAGRALALASTVALAGLSSLQLMALGARRQLGDDAAAMPIVVAVDARKEQIYVQSFDAQLIAMAPPKVISPLDALQYLPEGRVVAVGNGAAQLAQALTNPSQMVADDRTGNGTGNGNGNGDLGSFGGSSDIDLQLALPDLQPDARDLGQQRADIATGRQSIRPLYLRPADAKPQTGKSIARAR